MSGAGAATPGKWVVIKPVMALITRETREYICKEKNVKFLLNRIIMLGAVPSFCIFLEHLWKVWVENFPKLRHLATNLPSHTKPERKQQSLSQETIFLFRVSTPLFFFSVVLLQHRHSVMRKNMVLWLLIKLSYSLGGSHTKIGVKDVWKSAIAFLCHSNDQIIVADQFSNQS